MAFVFLLLTEFSALAKASLGLGLVTFPAEFQGYIAFEVGQDDFLSNIF